jgi:hypothetical protein
MDPSIHNPSAWSFLH